MMRMISWQEQNKGVRGCWLWCEKREGVDEKSGETMKIDGSDSTKLLLRARAN